MSIARLLNARTRRGILRAIKLSTLYPILARLCCVGWVSDRWENPIEIWCTQPWWTTERSGQLPGRLVAAGEHMTRGPNIARMTSVLVIRGEPFACT